MTIRDRTENGATDPDLLQLVRRLYGKRDEILESSQKLVEYAHRLEQCDASELRNLLAEVGKELNRIIAAIHELSPHLKNPNIAVYISEEARMVGLEIESLAHSSDVMRAVHQRKLATYLRVTVCQDANKTELRPTPKSIRQAYGVEVSVHDVVNLKGYSERSQDNY